MALTPYADALARLLQEARPVDEGETVLLAAAVGRVLAEDVTSTIAVPPADNSAMDGYALRIADLATEPLPVSARIPAGRPAEPLIPASCARIFTGAEIPAGADAVVMQEQVRVEADGRIRFPESPRPGQNIRPRGQDIAEGSQVVAAGTRLQPVHIGLLASVGQVSVKVRRRLRVALLCTGDELAEPGQALAPGQIYNSNRPLFTALLHQAGCEVLDLGRVPDRREATLQVLAMAAESGADLILSTGGVSVGEEDHVRAAVQSLGQIDLWSIAIKPGKPLAYGRIGTCAFIGLPGNPISGLVTYAMLVRPYLRRCQGLNLGLPAPQRLAAAFARPRPGDRDEFLRVRLNDEGRLEAHPQQNSGVLSSAAWADGLAMVPAGATVSPEQSLAFYPFSALLD